ncbi:M1 family metallopeptidase [Pontimicrobium sp. MEBiC06410]
MKYILAFFFLTSLFVKAQQTNSVDYTSINAALNIKPEIKEVSGIVQVEFNILKATDSIYIDAVGMEFDSIVLNEAEVKTVNDGKKLWIINDFKASKHHELVFKYKVKPKKALYFIDWDTSGRNQVWTQGQGKYTSHWLPSIDDMNDKIEFDLAITFDNNYQVIANGKLEDKIEKANKTTWIYEMKKPMSSYLVALAIGKYNKKVEQSLSGIPLELYYYPEDSAKVEPTYRYTKAIFNFLEKEIGVKYPWQNYKQIPVKDFLYSGMENTSATIFSDSFVVDSIAFVDKNYVNVNAHELAHQWFGDLVTETSGAHHWLQEGFATYYALLAEREVFGAHYYYWRLYEYAQELTRQEQEGQHTALLNPKSSSTTFYKKGALLLFMLQEKIGDAAFKKGVKSYLEQFKYKNVSSQDFIVAVEKASGEDLTTFFKQWLEDAHFYYDEVEEQLVSNSEMINGYLQINCEAYSSKCSEYLTSWIFDASKIKVIEQMPNRIQAKDFKNSVKVRQAIAVNLRKVPWSLKQEYESLLNDKSYVTVESALYNLINSFPENTKEYLEKTKHIIGFNDKNVRQLWLFLALITEAYSDADKRIFYKELVNYTKPEYTFEVRQLAFEFLNAIRACNEECAKNLKQATTHHNWRFKKFAKELLNKKE